MSLSRSIFSGMMAQFMGRLYTSVISFIVTMVMLARILSPDDFGIFNFYLTLFYIFMSIIDFGANTIAVREASKDIQRLPGLLLALVRLRGMISLLAMLVVWGSAFLFESGWNMRLLICLAGLHLLFHSLGGFNTVFHVRMRFDYVALVAGFGHTLFLLFSLAVFFWGSKNPALYLVGYGVGIAGANLANYLMCRPMIPGGLKGRRPDLGPLFREALPLGISSVMVTVYFYIDTVLLRVLKGDAEVGYYNAAYRLLVFSLMVPVLFNQVLFPVYSRCFAKDAVDTDRLKRIFRRAVIYMGVTGIPAGAAIGILAEPILLLVCGETYLRSARCLAILSLAMAAIFLTYPHLSTLVASGRQVLFAWIAGCSGLLNLALNLILIPRYSFEGAAWATVISETLVLLCAVYCVKRYAKMTALDPEWFKILGMGGLVALGAFLLRDVHLLVSLPALGVFYFLLLYLFRLLPFDIRDETRH